MKHPKIHINQINEDQTQRANIIKAAREKQQITHKGIPISITVDLRIETLQARRECQDILKVMKEKNLQPRLLYPAKISFKYEGGILKLYRQAKAERIQHHQTSSSTDAKGSSLDRKQKRFINSNPKQQSKWQWDLTYQ